MPAAPIHHAIAHQQWDACRELLSDQESGGELAKLRGRSGATALAQALRKGAPRDVLELMLDSPSAAQAAKARVRHQSAADVAEELKADADIIARLRSLEHSVAEAPGKLRCPTCGDELSKYTALRSLCDCVQRGQETNALVHSFCAMESLMCDLEQVALHRVADCHNFRQEVTETMAVIRALRGILDWEQEAVHFVDLCCGSSMTAALLALRAPRCQVTAVDIRPAVSMPHYSEAGLSNVRYLCEDMKGANFFPALQAIVEEVALPVVVLGMHCCGALSVIATQIYNRLPQCTAIILCPCCFLKGADIRRAPTLMPEVPESLLQISESCAEEESYYGRWADGLAGLLPGSSCSRMEDMLTPCNAIICAQRDAIAVK